MKSTMDWIRWRPFGLLLLFFAVVYMYAAVSACICVFYHVLAGGLGSAMLYIAILGPVVLTGAVILILGEHDIARIAKRDLFRWYHMHFSMALVTWASLPILFYWSSFITFRLGFQGASLFLFRMRFSIMYVIILALLIIISVWMSSFLFLDWWNKKKRVLYVQESKSVKKNIENLEIESYIIHQTMQARLLNSKSGKAKPISEKEWEVYHTHLAKMEDDLKKLYIRQEYLNQKLKK